MKRTIEKTGSRPVRQRYRLDLPKDTASEKPGETSFSTLPESSSSVAPRVSLPDQNERAKSTKCIVLSMGISIATFFYFIGSGQLEFVSAISFLVGSTIGHGIGLLTLHQSFLQNELGEGKVSHE